ncbi:DUF977 family protein [Salmonella enterica]|nr:DUF977 family protein [Salmonella enterica]EBV4144257.1 DNA-binding protein [Salmonella enterica subsp. enterica serovar Benin]EBE6988751.1 DUF977 family protein [Salmonella enterica]EBE7298713.1 DUF977 family protein [Salmonella enterica]EBW4219051.1 DNA-binding protein [Salmonella enterica subsp. enterica serovar Benin]
MPRPKTLRERILIIDRLTELVNEHGHITTRDTVMLFGIHRTTAEKYLREAMKRGGFLRHGRSGIFRDQRAMIDFDMRRYSSHGKKSLKSDRVLPAKYGEVLGRVVQIYGGMV